MEKIMETYTVIYDSINGVRKFECKTLEEARRKMFAIEASRLASEHVCVSINTWTR